MKYLKFFITIIMATSSCLIMTSCDPDEVDAFAAGYRDGYYNSSTRAEIADIDTDESMETDTNAE